MPLWRQLTTEPQSSRLLATVDRANRAAMEAYDSMKAAAAAYIRAQIELAIAVRDARDAGHHVHPHLTSWLQTPPERAAVEARIEGEQHDAHLEQIDTAVEQILIALRDHGYEGIFRPEDVTIDGQQTNDTDQ